MKKEELQERHFASAARAKQAFKNFSLSKRKVQSDRAPEVTIEEERASKRSKAGSGDPDRRQQQASAKITYVPKGANVVEQQRQSINDQLDSLVSSGGMTLIIAERQIEAVINDNKVDLADLISRLEKAKTGTQFYTSGTTLQDAMKIQAKVDKIFSKYPPKNGADKGDDDAVE